MKERDFNTEKIKREYTEGHRGLLRNERKFLPHRTQRKYTQDCCAMKERDFNTEKIKGEYTEGHRGLLRNEEIQEKIFIAKNVKEIHAENAKEIQSEGD